MKASPGRPDEKARTKLKAFDAVVSHLYLKARLSTYQIAHGLKCSQGKVGRSLRRTRTPRRSSSEGYLLRMEAA
jgi:hypothetical protein